MDAETVSTLEALLPADHPLRTTTSTLCGTWLRPHAESKVEGSNADKPANQVLVVGSDTRVLLDSLPALHNVALLTRATAAVHHVHVSYTNAAGEPCEVYFAGASPANMRREACVARGLCCVGHHVSLPAENKAAVSSGVQCDCEAFATQAVLAEFTDSSAACATYLGHYGEATLSELICRRHPHGRSGRDDLRASIMSELSTLEAMRRAQACSDISAPPSAKFPMASSTTLDELDLRCMLSILDKGKAAPRRAAPPVRPLTTLPFDESNKKVAVAGRRAGTAAPPSLVPLGVEEVPSRVLDTVADSRTPLDSMIHMVSLPLLFDSTGRLLVRDAITSALVPVAPASLTLLNATSLVAASQALKREVVTLQSLELCERSAWVEVAHGTRGTSVLSRAFRSTQCASEAEAKYLRASSCATASNPSVFSSELHDDVLHLLRAAASTRERTLAATSSGAGGLGASAPSSSLGTFDAMGSARDTGGYREWKLITLQLSPGGSHGGVRDEGEELQIYLALDALGVESAAPNATCTATCEWKSERYQICGLLTLTVSMDAAGQGMVAWHLHAVDATGATLTTTAAPPMAIVYHVPPRTYSLSTLLPPRALRLRCVGSCRADGSSVRTLTDVHIHAGETHL